MASSGITDFGGERLVNIGTPTNDNHAATKGYVDTHSGGSLPAFFNVDDTTPKLTLQGNLIVAPTDPNVAVFRAVAPSGFAAGASFNIAELVDEFGSILYQFDASGDAILNGAQGEGASGVLMYSVDFPPFTATGLYHHRWSGDGDGNNGDRWAEGGGYVEVTPGNWQPRRRYSIQTDGTFSTFAHAARPDLDMDAGQLSFWFDQTNGAGKLMVKAKTADGTVVAGELALT